jgi:rhodanese-related sulfurtransferase
MRRAGLFLRWAVLIFSAFSILLTEAFAAEIPKVSKEDLQAMLGNPEVIIIDVRLSGNVPEGTSRIKGAVMEDPGTVESWMEKYPKDKTLIFYCA